MSRSALLKRRAASPTADMEQYGNTSTFNLETVLRENIVRSEYWSKTCIDLEGWQEVVDEIYYSVEHCEPWMSGNARGPSSAFCLLYRLCQLKPTPAQIRMMLDHKDSPYIRAVGFLYLRYVANPRELWGWYKKYLRDEEEFSPSPEGMGKVITMGEYVRDIVLDQYYFETIFPRIPKPVQDEIVADLKSMGLPTTATGNAGQGGADRRGVDDGGKRPASVKASLSVALGQRAPNRAGAREEGRGLGAGMKGGAGAARRARSPSADRQREQQARRRSRSPHRSERDRGDRREDKYDPYDKYDRPRSDRDRERDYRDSRRGDDRRDDRRRDDYDRRGDDRRRDDYDRRGDDRRRDDYDRRGEDRRDDRRRDDRYRDDRGRSPDRRRDEPRRDRSGEERDARDVFRERAGGSSAPADRIRDVYG